MTPSALNSAEPSIECLAGICEQLSPAAEMGTWTDSPGTSDFGTAEGHFVCSSVYFALKTQRKLWR